MSINTQEIDYQINGKKFISYLASSTDGHARKPAVLIAHEWWGRNDYAKGRAEQLANDGFIALAMDLYGDAEVATNPERAGELMNAARGSEGAIEARFDAAYAVLSEHPEVDPNNISVMGYCFGGAVALAMARLGKKLKVAASYHGLLQTNSPMESGTFDGKILVFNGADDPMVPANIMVDFKAEMEAAKANYHISDYPGVVHSFSNPAATAKGIATGMPLAYDQHADHVSYAQTLEALRL